MPNYLTVILYKTERHPEKFQGISCDNASPVRSKKRLQLD